MWPELITRNDVADSSDWNAGDTSGPPRVGTVVVAHRHRLYLEGLLQILKEAGRIEVVGQAESEPQLLECVTATRPEVVVFEPFETDVDDLDVLDAMHTVSPGTKILIIQQTFDSARLLKALRKGAWGYFSHSTTSEEFLKAIQATRRGELWVERAMLRRLLLESGEPVSLGKVPRLGDAHFRTLRPRELEIANLAAAGLSNKSIGSQLGITESTVKTHLVNIFRKFEIHHRMELAGFLRDRGEARG
jgi:two-component system nitrate/nitrite response regulator NarL